MLVAKQASALADDDALVVTVPATVGVMMLRWQQVDGSLAQTRGPKCEVVPFADLRSRVPALVAQDIGPRVYAERIEARQVGIARQMIS